MFFKSKKKKPELSAPATGQLINLTKVNDPVFAQGMMGPGLAIIPNDEAIYSPYNGSITSIFPTKHAIGMKNKEGKDILIHIGLNTVDLNGEGFDVFVEVGDNILAGDQLAKIDRAFIKSQGKDDTIVVVFPEYEKVITVSEREVQAKTAILLDIEAKL